MVCLNFAVTLQLAISLLLFVQLVLVYPSTELVPVYAFGDESEDISDLYLRYQGQQSGLHYRFRCHDSFHQKYPWGM